MAASDKNLKTQDADVRLAMCTDLLVQLLPHCRRRQAVDRAWSCEPLLLETHDALRSGGCALTQAEFDWLKSEVQRSLSELPEASMAACTPAARSEVVSEQGNC
jgi:hypothetical protein